MSKATELHALRNSRSADAAINYHNRSGDSEGAGGSMLDIYAQTESAEDEYINGQDEKADEKGEKIFKRAFGLFVKKIYDKKERVFLKLLLSGMKPREIGAKYGVKWFDYMQALQKKAYQSADIFGELVRLSGWSRAQEFGQTVFKRLAALDSGAEINDVLPQNRKIKTMREKYKKYRLAHPEKMWEKNKKYRLSHLEEVRERFNKWRAEHAEEYRESVKKWRAEHAEEYRALAKKCREKRKKEHAEEVRRYRAKHPEKIKEYGKEYYSRMKAEHPEKMREYQAAYRARKKAEKLLKAAETAEKKAALTVSAQYQSGENVSRYGAIRAEEQGAENLARTGE